MGSLLVSFLPSQKIIAPFDSSYDNIMKSGWKIGIVLEPDKPPSSDRSFEHNRGIISLLLQ